MKTGVISPSFNSNDLGQAIVLNRLLKTFDPKEFCLISSNYYGQYHDNTSSTPLGKIYYPFSLPQKVQTLILKTNFESRYISLRSNQYFNILKKEKCTQVICCTADLFSTLAALKATEKLNIPFILYSFDDYIYQWAYDSRYQDFAERTDQLVFKRSNGVIVPNEFLQKEYATRYGIHSIIIHNPVDIAFFKKNINPIHDKIRIIYTGSIYDVHYDNFRSLVKAIKINKSAQLHLFTNQSQKMLEKQGILDESVFLHKSVHYEEIPDVLANADILFLPLAFNSPYHESTIRTASPGKMGEYLASNRPILVNAPDFSYISWYFSTFNCGVVINNKNPENLSKGINQAYKNEVIIKSSKICAEKDFDMNVLRKKFYSFIKNL